MRSYHTGKQLAVTVVVLTLQLAVVLTLLVYLYVQCHMCSEIASMYFTQYLCGGNIYMYNFSDYFDKITTLFYIA